MTPRVAPLLLAGALLLSPVAARPLGAQECPAAIDDTGRGPLAVVLSGGGAKGLAHIGALRVLDSLGVQPDLVVGASMGALVGALYSSGLSGAALDSVARRLPLEALFRRYPPTPIVTAGDLTAPVTVLAPALALERRSRAWQLQSPAARGTQINALLNDLLLRANIAAGGDFDRLPRRFRAVATDFHTRMPVVLRDGDLPQAVRASVAIPLVFTPVRRAGRVLIDGGISANVPVAVARKEGSARLVIIDVGSIPGAETDVESTSDMLTYVLDLLFNQRADSLGRADVHIRPGVRGFTPLDFSQSAVDQLIDLGYRAAALTLRGCSVAGRARRPDPVPPAPDEARIADRMARLADAQVYESVWLNPRVAPGTDATGASIELAPAAAPGPRRFAGVGLSFDDHDGARAWVSATVPGWANGRIATGGLLSLGEWRQLFMFRATGIRRYPVHPSDSPVADSGAALRLPDPRANEPPWSTLTRDRIRPELSVTASHDVVRFFEESVRELSRPATTDLVVFSGASAAAGGLQVTVGPLAHLWSARGTGGVDEHHQAIGALVRAAHFFPVPATGFDRTTVPMLVGESLWLDDYRRTDFQATLRAQVGPVALSARGAVGWGERLPLSALLALGGPQGFPGLPVGVRRGDRRSFAAIAASISVAGPIHARVELGSGRTMMAGGPQLIVDPLVASGPVDGGEIGLAADTPVGPLIISYGIATGGFRGVKLRLGSF